MTEQTTTEVQAEPNMAEMTNNAESISPEELERLTTEIVAALKTVADPELPMTDIYELGLI